MNHDSPSLQCQSDAGTERWIDDELAQSFPASDPPSWTLGPAFQEDSPEAACGRTP